MLVQSVPMLVCRADLRFRPDHAMEFIDITADVETAVLESGICDGMVLVASQHTTAAIVVQENEPLLLEDLRDMLERIAPKSNYYRHDDFDVRVVNMHQNKLASGHAHCKHALLGGSKSIPLHGARMALGQWGRIFLVELDEPRDRDVQVQIIGI